MEPTISIVHHEVPELDYPKITLDHCLDPKLDDIPLINNLNRCFAASLLGPPGSGKTSLLHALFRTEAYFYKVFDLVYLYMPKGSKKGLVDDCFDTLPDDQKFEGVTAESLEGLMKEMEQNAHSDPPKNSCIIFDDVQADFKKKECEYVLKILLANRRHYRCSIFMVAQNYIRIPLDIRKILSDIFAFDVSMKEWGAIYEEHGKFYKKVWEEILNEFTNRVKQEREIEKQGGKPDKIFLYLNVPHREVFINFDQVILQDNDFLPDIDIYDGSIQKEANSKKRKRGRPKKPKEPMFVKEEALISV
jgi:hypothetical protein